MSIKKQYRFYSKPLTLLDILSEKSLNSLRKFGHIYRDPSGSVRMRVFKNHANNNTNH